MTLTRVALSLLALACFSTPAAAASPAGAGLAVSGGAFGGMITGGITGGAAWAFADVPNCDGKANDLCPLGGLVRATVFGVPLGGGLGSAATGALTHQLVVGHGSGRVLLAGLGPVLVGSALQVGAIAAVQDDKLDAAKVLLATGAGLSLIGPTVATGIAGSAEARKPPPVAHGPRVQSIALAPVQGGATVGIGGAF